MLRDVDTGRVARSSKRLQRLVRQLLAEAHELERAALPGDHLGTYRCAANATPDDLQGWLQAVLPERDPSQELVITVIAR